MELQKGGILSASSCTPHSPSGLSGVHATYMIFKLVSSPLQACLIVHSYLSVCTIRLPTSLLPRSVILTRNTQANRDLLSASRPASVQSSTSIISFISTASHPLPPYPFAIIVATNDKNPPWSENFRLQVSVLMLCEYVPVVPQSRLLDQAPKSAGVI